MFPPVAADGYEAVGSGRSLTADVVIVGTGPGGAAAARVLSEGGQNVVLLEEGELHARVVVDASGARSRSASSADSAKLSGIQGAGPALNGPCVPPQEIC